MKTFFRLNLLIGLAVLLLAVALLFLEVRFMKTWFYICVWWSLILILDSLNFRIGGSSPLFDSPKDFVFSAFVSIPLWLVFELFNLRLHNWSYHNLPSSLLLRWLGYFLAFASVIPALKELSTFFHTFLKKKTIPIFSLKVTDGLLWTSIISGALFLALCLLFPGIFFPLVWIGFVFLIDPMNYLLNADSLLEDVKRKNGKRILSWLLAGFAAGLLWELLNFWAGSHWEYTIPWLDFWKIFQMPVLGYGGFLPFAIEVFSIAAFLDFLRKKAKGKKALQAAIVVLILIFDGICFRLIDLHTLIP